MKSGFFALLLLLCASVSAQQTQLASRIPGTPQQTEFLPFSDHLSVIFIHENAAEIIVMDRDFNPLFERAVYDLGLGPGAVYLGVSEEQTGWHLYFLSRGSLVGVKIPRGGDTRIVRMEGYGNANFSGSFSFNGTMHLLRMSGWDNELRLVKFRDGQQVFSETFPIATTDFVSRASGDFHKMGEESATLDESFHTAKWYRFGDRLVFTLDTDNATEMVEIDLLTSTVHERRFDWEASSLSNSLCLGSYLIHCAKTTNQFSIDLYEMESEEHTYSCIIDQQNGIQESSANIGWYSNRHRMMADQGAEALVHIPDHYEWLESLASHTDIGISFAPSEQGFVLEAGALSSTEELGASGLVLDRHISQSTFSFELTIPGSEQDMMAPLVFSSLRYPGSVYSTQWLNGVVRIGRNEEGTMEFWWE